LYRRLLIPPTTLKKGGKKVSKSSFLRRIYEDFGFLHRCVYTVAFLRGVRGDLTVLKVTAKHFSNNL
jgi:hypothetical protein